jgi:hypothetical protein
VAVRSPRRARSAHDFTPLGPGGIRLADEVLVTASEPALMSTLPLELFEIDGEPSVNRDYGKGGTL